MNRHRILATLIVGLTAASVYATSGSAAPVSGGSISAASRTPAASGSSAASAREPEPRHAPVILESAPAGTVVLDDDGGRVQIVPRAGAAEREVAYHGGPLLRRAGVRAIFLGSGWRQQANRARGSRLIAALAGRARAASAGSLSRYGLEAVELAGPAHEDRADPREGRQISDLEIQSRLEDLHASGTLGPAAAGAVYMVFLAPGIRSTLGGSVSEKDFAAYHNHFHSSAGIVRYVVVPHDDEFSRWLANAEQGLVETLINPEGNGWY